MQLCCSEELDLADFVQKVTDLAGEAIASSESFKRVNLSGSVYQYSAKDYALSIVVLLLSLKFSIYWGIRIM